MREPPDGSPVPPYRAPAWLPGAHVQTIYPSLVPQVPVAYRRERVVTPDGDFWDFDWLASPAAPDAPLVVLFHGLESGSNATYARALMRHFGELGLRAVVPHFRGCSGEPNRKPRAYHSGDHAEIATMLAAIRQRIPDGTPVFAVGVSLGGSALLNWLGRAQYEASRWVVAAAAVSAPLDLMAAGTAIDQGTNRIYAYAFLRTLKPKALAMAERFPGLLDVERLRAAQTMWAFDDIVTAPLHGFAGVEDYWMRGSSKPWLAEIDVPTLVLNARNDPFIPGASLPRRGQAGDAVLLEQPEQGGHVGFMTGPVPGRIDWLPQRLLAFFLGAR
jgi:predicted alpha/beta-fold hydrolase